jgi:hypothetical protein
MRFRSYNSELLIAQTLIGNIFNDIVIDRRNHGFRDYSKPLSVKEIVQKQIEVPCIFGDRGIILRSLENETGNIKLPLYILQSNDISIDTSRNADLHIDMFYQADSQFAQLDKNNPLYRPYDLNKRRGQPVNIKYTLTLVTKYKEDLDQMCTNWAVFYRPSIYVKWWHPRNDVKPLESEILWDGSINYESPVDYTVTDRYQWKASTNFTFKTWLFPGVNLLENIDDNGETDLIKYFNKFSFQDYLNPEYQDEISKDFGGFPVYGELYNRENSGFFAAETDQEFENNGNDPKGILEGKYIVNNVESRPDSILYDKVSGILNPDETMIKNLTDVGDMPQSQRLTESYPDWNLYQDVLAMDPIESPTTIAFKLAYFKNNFKEDISKELENNLYFNTFFGKNFGESNSNYIKPEFNYNLDKQELTISGEFKNEYYIQSFESIINNKTINQEINVVNLKQEMITKFSKTFTANTFKLKTENTEFNNVHLIRDNIYFKLENKDFIKKLKTLKSYIKENWNDFELNYIEETNTYVLETNSVILENLNKIFNCDAQNILFLSVVKEWVENGKTYTILANSYMYFILESTEDDDNILTYGILNIPSFDYGFAPVFNTTFDENNIIYGFNLENNI